MMLDEEREQDETELYDIQAFQERLEKTDYFTEDMDAGQRMGGGGRQALLSRGSEANMAMVECPL